MNTEKDITEEFETGTADNEAKLLKIPTRRDIKGLVDSSSKLKGDFEKKVVKGGVTKRSLKIL